jgi:anaerobic selenocysteine-containing dehydrogenase
MIRRTSEMDNNGETKLVRTVCQECHDGCAIIVHVRDGRAIRVDSAPGLGAKDKLCPRAEASLERLYSPYRLLYPQKRTGNRGEGKWQRISWDEAMDIITQSFLDAKKNHGAESVALLKGIYTKFSDLVSRLGNAFGTPNVANVDNTCFIPGAVGRLMTYGYNGLPDISGLPDCIMCWGSSANPPLKEGGKLIVINTLQTEAAKRADIWLRPRPATDLALALGMINVIINEELYDKEFVSRWTTGFNKLEKHVQKYSPEKVAGITWVPAEKIIETARLFAGYRYACLMSGNASDDTYNSSQFARAVSIIQSICGLLEKPGGTIDIEGAILREATSSEILREVLPEGQEEKKLGSDCGYVPPSDLWYTISSKPLEVHPQHLVNALIEEKPYSIQAVGVFGSNPFITWSNSRRVYEAFSRVNFMVVADLVMTPTAEMADIVLPVASYLETDAVIPAGMGVGVTRLMAQQKAVQVGECKSTPEIIIELAQRLGIGEYFWKDLHSYLDDYLKPAGITFAELVRVFSMISSATHYRKYLEKGFNTPSGKVELYSSLCEKWGYEPLPEYHEVEQTPVSNPELIDEYPLILTSTHNANYVHSQDRYIEAIRRNKPEPLVIIHPETAGRLGIKEGDVVYIENRRGRIKQKATLNSGIDPRVVSVDYGWWFPEKGVSTLYGWDESNINILTDDGPPYSPEMGSPKMRGFLCKVYKA